MSARHSIIPYSPDPKGKKGGLISVRDLEAQRRAFETQAREATLSEVLSYYGSAGRRFETSAAGKTLIPAVLAKLPALVGRYNTLEAARERMGWSKKRAEAEASISGALSFRKGFERLRKISEELDFISMVKRFVGKRATEWTEEDALLSGANLTAEEVTWISVLKDVPRAIFQDNLLQTCTIVDHFYDGLEWAFDTLKDGPKNGPCDNYEVLGLTGVRDDTEFTRFETAFKALLVAYYYLAIGDADLFDRVWQETGHAAIQSGDGKVLRAFAHREGRDFDETFAAGARDRVNEWLARLRVVHMAKGAVLAPKDVVRLVGILEAAPFCLFSHGHLGFIPCGKGVMFLGPDLKEVEYVPMDPYVGHLAQVEIQSSAGSVDRTNRIWSVIFGRILKAIETKNVDDGHFTLLDEAAADIFLRSGIKVELGVRKAFQAPAASGKPDEAWFGAPVVKYSYKIGFFTLTIISEILEAVPPPLLRKIKTIRRDDFRFSMEEFETGSTKWGEFNETDGTLTVFHPHVKEMDEVAEEQFRLCMAHEVGHGAYISDARIGKAWRKLSRASPTFPIPKRAGEFLTAYASTSRKEDFADHFGCFVVFGDEFRRRAAGSPALAAKYGFMKRLFGKEFEQDTTVTIESVNGPISYDFALQAKINEEVGEDLIRATLNRQEFMGERALRKPLKGPSVESIERKGQEPVELPYVVEPEPIIRRIIGQRLGRKARFVPADELEYHLIKTGRSDIAAAYVMNRVGCALGEAEAHVRAIMDGLREFSDQMRAINEMLGERQVEPRGDDEEERD